MQQTPSNLTPIRPDIKFLFRHPAHLMALGLGSGLSPFAPGTAGTLFAWFSFHLITLLFGLIGFSPLQWPLTIALSFFIGLWACRITAENMRTQDPGAIVWDEVVAFWLVFYSLAWLPFPNTFIMQAIAFILFRLFDMVKIGPVRWADQHFKGAGYRNAFGIMFDDIVAAILTIIVLYSASFLLLLFNHV